MVELPSLRLRWAGPAPSAGLGALGVDDPEALLAADPLRLARARELPAAPGSHRVAFALPGTADVRGNLTGRPGELGTGFVWLTSHRPPLGALLRARFGAPRSASLAEREWNVLCLLRAAGVGTPEPLCVGALGQGLVARRSFLVVRALEDAFPFPRWLATDGLGAERERGLAALGALLARLARTGLVLPELAPEHLWVTPSGSGECETDGPGLRKNKLPGVSVVDVRGARRARSAHESRRALAEVLARVEGLEARERDGVLARAAT